MVQRAQARANPQRMKRTGPLAMARIGIADAHHLDAGDPDDLFEQRRAAIPDADEPAPDRRFALRPRGPRAESHSRGGGAAHEKAPARQ